VEGEVKASAPLRAESAPALTSPSITTAAAPPSTVSTPASPPRAPSRLAPLGAASASNAPAGADLPELREHIRARRAALAGFMEQGASLALDGDLLRVIPRNDIYIRYLNDNRGSIGELASELYGRKLRVEVSLNGAADAATGGADAPSVAPPAAASSAAGDEEGATLRVAPSSSPAQPFAAALAPGLAAGKNPPPPIPARSLATDRQVLYADPVVRRIFEELQGRLVDVRERPAAAPSAPPAALGASANNDPAPPATRRPSQE